MQGARDRAVASEASASAQAERTAGLVFVASRVGQLAFSGLMIAGDRQAYHRAGAQLGILAGVTAESVWLGRRILRAGGYDDRTGMWVDTLTSAAALVASHPGMGPRTAPWAKNIAIGAAIGAASGRASDASAALATICAAGIAIGRQPRGRDAHVAGLGLAVNDAISWAGVSVASRVYLGAHRRYARDRDTADALTVERGTAAAAQDERARQHQALHRVTVDVLRRVAACSDAAAAEAIARPEALRLRYALRTEGRLTQGLDAALTALVIGAPLTVELVTAELGEDPGPAVTAAVHDAAAAALAAAARYGHASSAVVRAVTDGADLHVSIRDHGCGFDPAGGGEYADALATIGRAVDQVGGTARIWSAPGRGARIDVSVPSAPASTVPVPTVPVPNAAQRAQPGAAAFRTLAASETRRAYRTMLAAVLTWRATGLGTGAAALLAGRHRLRRPGLAHTQLGLGVAESLWYARRVSRLDRWDDPAGSVVDAGTAATLLVLGQAALHPSDRNTWLNWAPWSFATSAISAQSMADHSLVRRLAGVAAVSAAHVVQGPRAGDAMANAVAHAGFGACARLLAAQIRGSAVRLQVAREAAVEQGRALARARVRADQLRRLHDSAVQTLESVAAGRYPDLVAIRAQALAEAEVLESELRRDVAPLRSFDEELDRVLCAHRALGLAVDTHREPVAAVPAAVSAALTAACHEALTNVTKHAGTRAARVRVRADGDGVILVVEDDGRGFAAGPGAGGFGMTQSIEARMADAGGTASIASVPGAGTTVTLRWPR